MNHKLGYKKKASWKFIKSRGFTLIELLVVVSIIGILTTLVAANLNSARQRGRDAQRKSDMRNIQTALRIYYNDYNQYPEILTFNSQWIVGDVEYMALLPDDALAPDREYVYNRIDLDTYELSACLENKSDPKCPTGGEPPAWCSAEDGCAYTVGP